MSELDRKSVEAALAEYRKSTGRSEHLDNPAKSMCRGLGDDNNLMSGLLKSIYAIGVVDDISQNLSAIEEIEKMKKGDSNA